MQSDLTDILLSSLVFYGLPLIFATVLIASAGLPLPTTLVVLTAGALVQQGLLSMIGVLGICLSATVLGDHLGYWLGWWGGRPLIRRIAPWVGGESSMERAMESTQRYGWLAVFFSRWLITPLGAPCNWICGSLGYALLPFFLADLFGEAIYVFALVHLGFLFGDQLENVSALISALGPWLVGILIIGLTLWFAIKQLRKPANVLLPQTVPVDDTPIGKRRAPHDS